MTENPTPQKGDRVRIVHVTEGVVTLAGEGGLSLRTADGYLVHCLSGGPGVRTIEILTPAEPPIGSVALDRHGLAWQRRGAWNSTDDDLCSWADLQGLGPLTVIHRGGDDDE